jgi:hypothetical protein
MTLRKGDCPQLDDQFSVANVFFWITRSRVVGQLGGCNPGDKMLGPFAGLRHLTFWYSFARFGPRESKWSYKRSGMVGTLSDSGWWALHVLPNWARVDIVLRKTPPRHRGKQGHIMPRSGRRRRSTKIPPYRWCINWVTYSSGLSVPASSAISPLILEGTIFVSLQGHTSGVLRNTLADLFWRLDTTRSVVMLAKHRLTRQHSVQAQVIPSSESNHYCTPE